MSNDWFHNQKERQCPQQHGPARVDGYGKSKRKSSRDSGADVRYEAQHRSQNAPENRTGNTYDPQTNANSHTEGSVQKKGRASQPAVLIGCGDLRVEAK